MIKKLIVLEGELHYHDDWGINEWRVDNDSLEEILKENKGKEVKITIEVVE